ncbi:MAG TPA: geranylgeranyl reductase family protein, partial [Anaerolineales bacterium]|nr:geranylgeranyl reductase family protein [Anaerolineales bacterium]
MPDLYDVIIVGAGPGGATAAYYLGEVGKRVLLLEKETLPRYKACGGGVSARLLAETFPFSFEPVIETRIQAVAYVLDGNIVTVPVPDYGVQTVMRDRFDAHILSHAKAEVRQGVTVRNVTEAADRVIVETATGETFETRYLIGADGANSVVARSLKLRRGKITAAAIEAEVLVSPEVMRRFNDTLWFIFGDIHLGYAWIFPKANHLSVGIAALHPAHGELQTALARMAARYGLSLDGVQLRGHPIPIYTRREPIATRRALLVGDAAGLADPFTGEGIRLAIKSGRLAAQAILAGSPQQYPGMIYRQIGMCHLWGLGLAHIFFQFQRAFFTLG